MQSHVEKAEVLSFSCFLIEGPEGGIITTANYSYILLQPRVRGHAAGPKMHKVPLGFPQRLSEVLQKTDLYCRCDRSCEVEASIDRYGRARDHPALLGCEEVYRLSNLVRRRPALYG